MKTADDRDWLKECIADTRALLKTLPKDTRESIARDADYRAKYNAQFDV